LPYNVKDHNFSPKRYFEDLGCVTMATNDIEVSLILLVPCMLFSLNNWTVLKAFWAGVLQHRFSLSQRNELASQEAMPYSVCCWYWFGVHSLRFAFGKHSVVTYSGSKQYLVSTFDSSGISSSSWQRRQL